MREQESYSLEELREILKNYILKAIEIVEGRNTKDSERSPLEITKLREFIINAQDAREKSDQLADPAIMHDLITQALELDLSDR